MHMDESILYWPSVSSIRDKMSIIPVFSSSSPVERITLVSTHSFPLSNEICMYPAIYFKERKEGYTSYSSPTSHVYILDNLGLKMSISTSLLSSTLASSCRFNIYHKGQGYLNPHTKGLPTKLEHWGYVFRHTVTHGQLDCM